MRICRADSWSIAAPAVGSATSTSAPAAASTSAWRAVPAVGAPGAGRTPATRAAAPRAVTAAAAATAALVRSRQNIHSEAALPGACRLLDVKLDASPVLQAEELCMTSEL
eukprot:CAMPEP_0171225600 /NCGR_PEP_ID=MMETSP0790-20130122/36889_1 /TAXON_ID=2925 /ORGANISM="Alexandrium catenella, Strain OF101" /LENGTH=109 /DNA_ID=CAMNT_0011691635 /DNA_START=57 /DNA_END=386 /DNA_ORIENTATION=+